MYPFRLGCPKSVWRSLIAKAIDELTFAGYTSYFLWLEHPGRPRRSGGSSVSGTGRPYARRLADLPGLGPPDLGGGLGLTGPRTVRLTLTLRQLLWS